MYVRCDESSLYSRINYVHSPWREPLQECPGIVEAMHTGFSAYTCALCQRGADTEEQDIYG